MKEERIELKQGERIDDLERNNYQIIQNPNAFCFGIDAVLLTEFAYVKEKERCLDLGSGTGIIPILLSAKTPGRSYIGLEIQEESVDMANRSIHLNNLEDFIEIKQGDLKEASHLFGRASFEVVTCNPPYMNEGHGKINPNLPKAIARHEILCQLKDVIREASAVLKPKGRFYLVHRPFRLAEIFRELSEYSLEPKRMRFVHPFIDKEPNIVLIEAIKDGKPRILIEKPYILYQKPGVYTEEFGKVYRF